MHLHSSDLLYPHASSHMRERQTASLDFIAPEYMNNHKLADNQAHAITFQKRKRLMDCPIPDFITTFATCVLF
jgi:hypothetical protein